MNTSSIQQQEGRLTSQFLLGADIQGLISLQELPTYSSPGVGVGVYFCLSHFLFISLLHLSFLCARREREQKHAAL